MKLLGLVALACWYLGAVQLRRRGKVVGWQLRCLNCQHVMPVSKSRILSGIASANAGYTLEKCDKCQRLVGVAVERVEEGLPA